MRYLQVRYLSMFIYLFATLEIMPAVFYCVKSLWNIITLF